MNRRPHMFDDENPDNFNSTNEATMEDETDTSRKPKVHQIHIHVEPREPSCNGSVQNESEDDHGRYSHNKQVPNTTATDSEMDLSNGNDVENPKQHEQTIENVSNNEERSTQSPSRFEETENSSENYDVPAEESIKENSKNQPTPEQKINYVMQSTKLLESKVSAFSGCKHDKEYLYLDEMLTRNLITLDDIDVAGNEELRVSRRTAVRAVSNLIHKLENFDKATSEDKNCGETTPAEGSDSNNELSETGQSDEMFLENAEASNNVDEKDNDRVKNVDSSNDELNEEINCTDTLPVESDTNTNIPTSEITTDIVHVGGNTLMDTLDNTASNSAEVPVEA